MGKLTQLQVLHFSKQGEILRKVINNKICKWPRGVRRRKRRRSRKIRVKYGNLQRESIIQCI
jgi:hypothetical protein